MQRDPAECEDADEHRQESSNGSRQTVQRPFRIHRRYRCDPWFHKIEKCIVPSKQEQCISFGSDDKAFRFRQKYDSPGCKHVKPESDRRKTVLVFAVRYPAERYGLRSSSSMRSNAPSFVRHPRLLFQLKYSIMKSIPVVCFRRYR